jgi:hypothetical protein
MQVLKTIPVITIFAATIIMTGCSKQVDQIKEPAVVSTESVAATSTASPQLFLSASRLVLLAGNAKNTAARFNWQKFACADNMIGSYTLQACVSGNGFADAIDIASTGEGQDLGVSVEQLNDRLRNIVLTGTESRVDFRIRLTTTGHSVMYSQPIALEVVTYQPMATFSGDNIIRVPGNYQSWKIPVAPVMVSAKNDREYEGYINFNNNYAQFLLVKNVTTWDDGYTFTDIGAGKFGFNGRMFAVWEGAGIYKCNVSANTNQWSCTRIFNWSVNGSATNGADMEMEFDAGSASWVITGNFQQGKFIFRANHANQIVLGHNNEQATGSLAYNAQTINIPSAGKYKIALSLINAGNYNYGIQRVY